jgi:hypothetical protein
MDDMFEHKEMFVESLKKGSVIFTIAACAVIATVATILLITKFRAR